MDRESVERLRFDRRLHSRRGWVEGSDLSQHIESLEDVANKMTTTAELEAEEAAATQSADTQEAPAFAGQPPTPQSGGLASQEPAGAGSSGGVAGDFSSGRSTLGGGGFGGGSDGSAES